MRKDIYKFLITTLVIGFLLFIQTPIFAYHKVINFQVENAYPPFEYEYNARAYGFAIDLANLIFEQDKYFLHITYDTWPKVYKRLAKGEIDMTGLMVILEERKKDVLYSKPVLTTHVGIYTKKGHKSIDLKTLKGLNFGVQKASFTENFLKNKLKISKYKTYLTLDLAINALLRGEIDAILETQEVANNILVKNNLLNEIELKVKDIFEVDFAYGVSKKHPELVKYINSRLDYIISGGIFDQIYYNYFSTYSSYYYEKKNRDIILTIVFVFILAVIIWFVTVFILSLSNRKLQKGMKSYEKYAELMAANANIIVLTLNPKGDIIFFNRFAEEITGYKKEEVVGKNWVDIFIPEHKKQQLRDVFQEIIEKKVLNECENEIITKDGKILYIMWNNVLIEAPILNEPLIISTGVDITSIKQTQKMLEESYEELEESNEELRNTIEELQKQEEQLRQEEERYRFIVENITEGVWEYDINKKEVNLYGHLKDIFNWKESGSKNNFDNWIKLYHPDDIRNILETIQKALELKDDKIEYEARMLDKDENYRWIAARIKVFYDEYEKPIKMLGVNIDVTAKKEYEEKMRYLVYHDQLTGLPNRKYFEEELATCIQSAIENGKMGAAILMDIDNFKDVNDIFGHVTGDAYLKKMGKKIEDYLSNLHKKAFLCRFGGDEFALILDDIIQRDEVINICSQLQKLFEQECYLDESAQKISTTISMGIVFYPDDGKNVKEILRNVDMALSNAKENGKNDFQVFMQFLLLKNLKKIEVEKELKKAIDNDEFELYYQPIVDIKTLDVVETEGLVRWISPQKGVVLPLEFIPIAEETGLIIKIGEMVINKALMDLSEWNKKGIDVKISINLSAKQFKSKYFADMIKKFIEKYNVNPFSLSFEITETTAMKDFDVSLRVLNTLTQAGIKFLIDDFGTGYSSLVYLKKLPISGIKIDKNFITELEFSKESQTIVEGIILMAHKLNLKVVAEGVETKRQFELLRTIGCDLAQGYLFSKPIPKKDIEKLILEKKIYI